MITFDARTKSATGARIGGTSDWRHRCVSTTILVCHRCAGLPAPTTPIPLATAAAAAWAAPDLSPAILALMPKYLRTVRIDSTRRAK